MKKTQKKKYSSKNKKVEIKINKKSILGISAIIPIGMIIVGVVIFLWGIYDLMADGEKKDESDINVTISEVTPTGKILDEGGISVKEGDEDQQNTINDTDSTKTGSDMVQGIQKALTKSLANQERMKKEGRWIATDYSYGDIQTNNYTVQRGDTLWEIAEAAYGNGALWRNILNANSSSIGFLPNGSQALIIPGQILTIP